MMTARTYSTVDWRKYLIDESNPRIKNFLDSRGYDVFNQICLNINHCVINNKEKLVMLVHPNAGNVILIEKEEFSEVYDIALKWFLKNEHYEMCSKLKNFKDSLDKKASSPKERIKNLI